MSELEKLREEMKARQVALRTAERALRATPEWAAVQSAQDAYDFAEEAFSMHGGEDFCEVSFCESCGTPLRENEIEHQAISDDGDTAPFCKDAASCNKRGLAGAPQ